MVVRHREQAIKFEEFKRLRVSVDTAVEPFSTARSDLDNVRLQDFSVTKLRNEVGEINKRIASEYPKLRDSLAALDASECCAGDGWAASADQIWDSILTTFDRTQNKQRTEAEAKSALVELIAKFTDLRSFVATRLASEVTRYSQAS